MSPSPGGVAAGFQQEPTSNAVGRVNSAAAVQSSPTPASSLAAAAAGDQVPKESNPPTPPAAVAVGAVPAGPAGPGDAAEQGAARALSAAADPATDISPSQRDPTPTFPDVLGLLNFATAPPTFPPPTSIQTPPAATPSLPTAVGTAASGTGPVDSTTTADTHLIGGGMDPAASAEQGNPFLSPPIVPRVSAAPTTPSGVFPTFMGMLGLSSTTQAQPPPLPTISLPTPTGPPQPVARVAAEVGDVQVGAQPTFQSPQAGVGTADPAVQQSALPLSPPSLPGLPTQPKAFPAAAVGGATGGALPAGVGIADPALGGAQQSALPLSPPTLPTQPTILPDATVNGVTAGALPATAVSVALNLPCLLSQSTCAGCLGAISKRIMQSWI